MSHISIKNTFKKYKEKIICLMGKKSLYSDEITKMCRTLFGRKYIGTYAQDKIPLGLNGYMIVNTDISGKPGQHWIALVLNSHTCYIFDSFGRKAEHLVPILEKKLQRKHYVSIDADRKPEQYGNSEICGQLSIAFLLTVHKYGIEKTIKVV
jgi:hypothetical protein